MWKCLELVVLLRGERFMINQEGLAGTGKLALSALLMERFDQEAFTLATSSLLKKTDDPVRLLESFSINTNISSFTHPRVVLNVYAFIYFICSVEHKSTNFIGHVVLHP